MAFSEFILEGTGNSSQTEFRLNKIPCNINLIFFLPRNKLLHF